MRAFATIIHLLKLSKQATLVYCDQRVIPLHSDQRDILVLRILILHIWSKEAGYAIFCSAVIAKELMNNSRLLSNFKTKNIILGNFQC